MVINSNYSVQQNQQKRQQNFGKNVLAPVVAAATFIESNGFLGEFLTIDAMGMGVPRTVQGYNRNKDELGHLNYKAGREEMIRELLSGPAFFFIPAISLIVAAALKGKASKLTTNTLDVFKGIMSKTSQNISSAKESKEIKTKFVSDFFDAAFGDYQNKGNHVDNLKKMYTEYLNGNDRGGFLGIGNKAKKKLNETATETLITLNKNNGLFLDNATSFKVNGKELDITQMANDFDRYLQNYTEKAAKSSEPLGAFTDKFHETAKRTRQITNILAGGALGAFLLAIPKLYQTGKEFPGVDGLDTTKQKSKTTKQTFKQNNLANKKQQQEKQTVNFSGNKFDKAANWFNIDQHNSFSKAMFFALSGIFMLGARFVQARGTDEKREVLTRDIPAVVIAVYGASLLNNGLAKLATTISGIPMKTKNFVSQKQIESWYTGFDKLKDPVISFAETINRNKGKLNKVFEKLSLTEDVKNIVGKDNATNDEIIDALKKAQDSKDAKFVALETKLKNLSSMDNKLFKSARNIQACVKLGALGIVASILGFALPRLNIVMTRNKYLNNKQNEPIKNK